MNNTVNRASLGAKKNLLKFKWLLLSIVLSIACINTAWADVHLYNGYVKIRFNGDMKFDGNYYEMYGGGPNATVETAAQLGTLTGELQITDIKMKINTNYWTKSSKHTMWYNIDGSNTNKGEYTINWGSSNGDGNPEHTGWANTVARGTDPSGHHSINVGFYSDFEHGSGWESRQELKTYYFSYTIMPPDVGTISVSATGALAGDGTAGNPYIVAYGGTLQLDITGATQAEGYDDPNSSAQYSIDNSNWGTETANTRKTISNVTSTTTSNWMVYARFHNSTASLTGAQKGKTIYYKAESRYNITATASPAAGGTVTPTSATMAGQYSGGDITASPYVGYRFYGWTKTSGAGSFVDASLAETKFKPTTASTVQAAFVRTYAYIEGRFQIKNAARNSTTTTYDEGGQWASGSTKIIMSYDGGNKRHELHTYMTPSELSANHGTGCDDCKPYFYIKTSTGDESLTDVTQYWASIENTTISGTGTGSGATLTHTGDLDDNNLRISSSDVSGYAVLYFDESKVWYELEQTLNYASNGGSGAAPAEAYHMKNSTTSAAAANTFTAPTGYHFDHWAGSNSTNYNAGATVTMSANLTLTAQWEPNTFKVTFNANGGDGEMADQNFTYDATQALTANAFTKAGFYFEGWAETAEKEAAVVKRDQADGCTLSTTNGATKTLYAKWKAISSIATDCWDGDTYKCEEITNLATPEPAATATWSGANWGGTPSLTTDVVIPANMAMTVNVDHAQAKSISLGSSSTLSIDPNKGLEVAGTITKADGSAPTASDLVLESSASGNATLIFNNSNFAAATVQMYSIASVDGSTWNWQYMAPAFTDANALYDYYGSYLYKWNNGGWSAVANGATLDAFAGYCITNKTANSKYVTDGTLVPTTSHTVNLGEGVDMVIGNSWTAPIYIGGFTAETFTSEPATIYLFNTGSAPNGSSAGTGPGTYETVPLFSALYVGNALIAPLQAFFVTTVDGSAGTITMNYDELVRTTTNDHSVNAGPMHAPKRVNEEENPEVMKIWAIGAEYSDRLVILEREDFTTGFDNGWDGEKKSFSDVAPSVYVIAETEKDAVSAVPDYEGTILGFLAGIDTQCTMNFDYNGEENWYLNDLKEEKSTLITNENSYSFSCSSTDAETRFVISKSPIHKVPTGIENVTDGANARKQMINGALYIVRDGRIYNAEGALVK